MLPIAERVAAEPPAAYGPRVTLPDISSGELGPGEALCVAILEREQAGCPTWPLYGGVSAPRLWAIPQPSDDLAFNFGPRDRRPVQVRPAVWAALLTRDALGEALDDRRSSAQLRWLAAAGLHDLAGLAGSTIADELEYASELPAFRAAAKGRLLLAALNAWPWACLPSGAPSAGWWKHEPVRHGWRLWTGQPR